MKKLLLFPVLLSTALLSARTSEINPIIGDQSYILKYGHAPNEHTPDQQRIAAHLEYAEFVLRSKDVSGMSAEQVQKRTHLLDLLHAYWTRGVFPLNEDVKNERRPCFIDHNGTICAVGYLVEQTAGHDVAEIIGERFMYNEILEMNDPVVLNWIEQCGLTREECAIIQPSYGPRHVYETQFSYGVSGRLADNLYHSIGVYFLKYRNYSGFGGWGRKGPKVASVGLRFDLLNDGNFSLGWRYTRVVSERQSLNFVSLGIMPEYFHYSRKSGVNLKPEVELSQTRKWAELALSYSYAIPIASASAYGAGRHDVYLRLGINVSDIKIKKRTKSKTDNAQEGRAFRAPSKRLLNSGL